jgi:hypothetical protein
MSSRSFQRLSSGNASMNRLEADQLSLQARDWPDGRGQKPISSEPS